jgi:hypothetical protein
MSRKATIQPVPAVDETPMLEDLIGEITVAVAGRSAILQKLAEAWQEYDEKSINPTINAHFWRGVDDLMRANLEDLDRLYAAANEK